MRAYRQVIGKTHYRVVRKLSKVPYFLVMTVWMVTPLAVVAGAKSAPKVGVGKTHPLVGYHQVWEARLPVGGKVISSPILRWGTADTYRVQVTGVLDTQRLGAKYDAAFSAISAQEFRVRHDHLRFKSPSWVAVYAHHRDHRYVYGLDPQAARRPERLRLSLEGIAFKFRISPARLERESSSTLRVSIWKKGAAPNPGGPVRWDFAAFFAGLALVIWLIVWWVRRRRARMAR